MKKHLSRIGFILLILLTNPLADFPAEAALSAKAIVEKAVAAAYYQGKDGRAQVSMTITDAQNRKRTRRFTLLRRNVSGAGIIGDQQFYVYFHRPADVKKMVFMVLKKIGKDDDRWLYLPALDLVKRIAASDERTSFVGSHFFYEDVSGRGMDEDVHELLEETDQYYVIQSRPKKPDAVEFAYYKNWVDKKTFVPMKAEYYKNDDRVYRRYTVLKVEVIDGHATAVHSEMKDLIGGGKTVLSYAKVKYDIGLPETIFSERYLRRAPRKYLR